MVSTRLSTAVDEQATARVSGRWSGVVQPNWRLVTLSRLFDPVGSMFKDGNNTMNGGATLKIRWRPEVKHHRRGRVVMAWEVVLERRMRLHSLAADTICA